MRAGARLCSVFRPPPLRCDYTRGRRAVCTARGLRRAAALAPAGRPPCLLGAHTTALRSALPAPPSCSAPTTPRSVLQTIQKRNTKINAQNKRGAPGTRTAEQKAKLRAKFLEQASRRETPLAANPRSTTPRTHPQQNPHRTVHAGVPRSHPVLFHDNRLIVPPRPPHATPPPPSVPAAVDMRVSGASGGGLCGHRCCRRCPTKASHTTHASTRTPSVSATATAVSPGCIVLACASGGGGGSCGARGPPPLAKRAAAAKQSMRA